MKMYRYLFLLFFASSSLVFSQIPNNGFEAWTDGEPDSWISNNLQGLATTVTQSSTSRSGQSAAKIEVSTFSGGAWPGILTCQVASISQRYGSMMGYYQFSPVNINNSVSITVLLSKEGSFVGGGNIQIEAAASSYTQFVIPMEYGSDETPDNAYIQIAVFDSSENSTSGSFALIDDLEFGALVGVENESLTPDKFDLKQNYPNPFNPSTKIDYSVPQKSFVQIKVYDIIGNEVEVLVNSEKSAGNYSANFNGSSLPSGIYIVQMKSGKFSKSLKMTLMK